MTADVQRELADEDTVRAALQPRLDEADATWVMDSFIIPLLRGGNADAGLLADVLSGHRQLRLRISWVAYPGCSCGWHYPAETHGDQRLAAWEKHRAAAALLPTVQALIAEEGKRARREQQLWDRKRVEDYAAVVGVELSPGDDTIAAVDELYRAALDPAGADSGEGR